MALNIIQVELKTSFNNFFFSDMGPFRTGVAALGKMFAEAAFTTVFLYTAELFPTVLRSVNYLQKYICLKFTGSVYIHLFPMSLQTSQFKLITQVRVVILS